MTKKKWLGVVLTCVLAIAHTACSTVANIRRGAVPSEAAVLTVMTFNIRMGYGALDPDRGPYEMRGRVAAVPEVSASIAAIDPDIVALQEVSTWDQAKRLSESLDLNVVYEPHGPGPDGNWWGLAILSKYRIKECTSAQLSAPPYGPRSLLICQLDMGRRTMTVVNIHRDHREPNDASIQTLLKIVESIPKPLLIACDFNLTPFDQRMTALTKGRFADPVDLLHTASAVKARQRGTFLFTGGRIDYVLFDRTEFEPVDAGLTPDLLWEASDHIGFYTKLRLR